MPLLGTIAAVILMVLVCAGCQSPADRSAAAADYVSAYLRAASGGDEARGWSFLDGEVQAAMWRNDLQVYVAAVEASDWTGFAWEVADGIPEDSFEFVWVAGNAGDYPAYLTEPRGNFTLAAGEGAERLMSVRFGLFGSMTLFASGG